jgi:CDP-diacylglycerol--inositol 3-phosphatidyltransferase
MAGAKNRRQGTAEFKGQDNETAPGADTNGSAHVAARGTGEEGPQENIFLLWPNIIGMNCPAAANA